MANNSEVNTSRRNEVVSIGGGAAVGGVLGTGVSATYAAGNPLIVSALATAEGAEIVLISGTTATQVLLGPAIGGGIVGGAVGAGTAGWLQDAGALRPAAVGGGALAGAGAGALTGAAIGLLLGPGGAGGIGGFIGGLLATGD